jgi:hypothetical protein
MRERLNRADLAGITPMILTINPADRIPQIFPRGILPVCDSILI